MLSRNQSTKVNLFRFLFSAILVFALINAFVIVVMPTLERYYGAGGIRIKWDLLENIEEPVDWLILGDSSSMFAVDPEVIGEHDGTRALNLATVGDALAVTDVWLLKRYIERFGPPRKGVVVVHVWDIWEREFSSEIINEMPISTGLIFNEEGVDIPGYERLLASLLRLVPVYSSDRTLKRLAENPVQLMGEPRVPINEFGQMRIESANPKSAINNANWNIARLQEDSTLRVSAENRWALDQLAALSNQHRLFIALTSSPVTDVLGDSPEYAYIREQIVTEFDDWAAGSDQLHHILRDTVTYPPEKMVNADHVTVSGAVDFTRRLLVELDEILDTTPR